MPICRRTASRSFLWAVSVTAGPLASATPHVLFRASYVDKGDGTVEHNFFTKGYEEYTLFYRKLVEEGLMDPEAFTQTDPIARKNQSRPHCHPGAHYPAILDASKEYVSSHPAATTFLSARWSALTLSRTGLLIWGFREIT